MEPIQVALSRNPKKHKAVHVSFLEVGWNCTKERLHLLLLCCQNKLIHPSSHSSSQPASGQETCTELLCALQAPGAAKRREWSSQAGRDSLVNKPLHLTTTGAAVEDTRKNCDSGKPMVHPWKSKRESQRRLPGGGNLCRRETPPATAWARHWGMKL